LKIERYLSLKTTDKHELLSMPKMTVFGS